MPPTQLWYDIQDIVEKAFILVEKAPKVLFVNV